MILTTAYPQMFRTLYYQGTAAFFGTGMILKDLLRAARFSVPPLRFPLLLNGGFIKREISLLTNRHRYLLKARPSTLSRLRSRFCRAGAGTVTICLILFIGQEGPTPQEKYGQDKEPQGRS